MRPSLPSSRPGFTLSFTPLFEKGIYNPEQRVIIAVLRRTNRCRGNSDMKHSAVAALGAAAVAIFGATSAARAVTINFGFAAGDGSKTYTGTSLQESSALDL